MRVHGGRCRRGAVDFSSPQNPLGPPRPLRDSVRGLVEGCEYSRYPDYEYSGLRGAIAGYYGLEEELVVPLNGAAEALGLLLLVHRPSTLITLEPSFGDYHALSAASSVSHVRLPLVISDDAIGLDPGIPCSLPPGLRRRALLVVANPNNPGGSLFPRREVEGLLDCLDYDSLLVVDEAFMDLSGDETMLSSGDPRVVVVRSLTKSLAIPGLRVGFLYAADEGLSRLLDSARQPWNVNYLAAEAVSALLGGHGAYVKSYLEEARRVVAAEREYIARGLREAGLRPYRSQAPFILAWHDRPNPSMARCLESMGFCVRDASSFHYLTRHHTRISVRLRRDNEALIRAVEVCSRGDQGSP